MQLDWLFHRDDTFEQWGEEGGRPIVPSRGSRQLNNEADKRHVANQIGLTVDDIDFMTLSQMQTMAPLTGDASKRVEELEVDTIIVLDVYTVNGNRQTFQVSNVQIDWRGCTTMDVRMPVPMSPAPF